VCGARLLGRILFTLEETSRPVCACRPMLGFNVISGRVYFLVSFSVVPAGVKLDAFRGDELAAREGHIFCAKFCGTLSPSSFFGQAQSGCPWATQ